MTASMERHMSTVMPAADVGDPLPYTVPGTPNAVLGIPNVSVVIPKVSVVIPALNEAGNLPHVLPRIPTWVHEVVVVDGHSTDGTMGVAHALWPNSHVVRQERRRDRSATPPSAQDRRSGGMALRLVTQRGRGKGAALRSGYEACTGDIIVTMDADGSMDPSEIASFVAILITGADFAKGSRFVAGGASTDITPLRSAGNWFLTIVANLLYGARYSDITYGYNAFWRYCLPYMRVKCDSFAFEILIACRVVRAGVRVREVASFEHPRLHGNSNLHAVRDGWRILTTIIRDRLSPSLPRVTSVADGAWAPRGGASGGTPSLVLVDTSAAMGASAALGAGGAAGMAEPR